MHIETDRLINDRKHMARAIELARCGLYTTMPNPRVGCVLVRDEQVIGEGWHVRAGEGHAEVNALADAAGRGCAVAGATAYVTLEPCSHIGRTAPCCDALINAGITRVVYAMQDPNPQVAGQGLARLKQAGIEVTGPLLESEALELNKGFIKRMTSGLPYVRCKLAMSLDGRTAMASGESQWITGAAARSDVQRLRAKSCAVVTGIDSILLDDSSLTVRANELGLAADAAQLAADKQPLRVVLDSQQRLPDTAKALADPSSAIVVSCGTERQSLTALGVTQWQMPGEDGRIDLDALLRKLADQQCNEVLVEAGSTLAGAFVAAGLVDELIVYMAPALMGSSARPLLDLPIDTMAEKKSVVVKDIRSIGDDWRITATFSG